mmetsp:Transcript_68531/g.84054  ORF Transcript_68531/g.84054 Transcript_68531/m.84054 type:complete len:139 (+) Transcript_68531:133-549(+)
MPLSIWAFVLYSSFIPFFCVILLLITPKKFGLQKLVHKILSPILFYEPFTNYPVISIFLIFEGILWAVLAKNVIDLRSTYVPPSVQFPQGTLHPKSKLWREERNCYAVAWGFTSWWMLYIIWKHQKRDQLRDDLKKQL